MCGVSVVYGGFIAIVLPAGGGDTRGGVHGGEGGAYLLVQLGQLQVPLLLQEVLEP